MGTYCTFVSPEETVSLENERGQLVMLIFRLWDAYLVAMLFIGDAFVLLAFKLQWLISNQSHYHCP